MLEKVGKKLLSLAASRDAFPLGQQTSTSFSARVNDGRHGEDCADPLLNSHSDTRGFPLAISLSSPRRAEGRATRHRLSAQKCSRRRFRRSRRSALQQKKMPPISIFGSGCAASVSRAAPYCITAGLHPLLTQRSLPARNLASRNPHPRQCSRPSDLPHATPIVYRRRCLARDHLPSPARPLELCVNSSLKNTSRAQHHHQAASFVTLRLSPPPVPATASDVRAPQAASL